MTLLIAWMIIDGLKINPVMYFVSFMIWILHIAVYDNSPRVKQIAEDLETIKSMLWRRR